MDRDRRLHFTPLQVVKTVLLMPLIATFLLLKTCVVRLLMGKPQAAMPDDADPGCWDVVCIGHVNWRHIWQRNHHTMSHLARRSKVLYINAIRLDTYCKHTPRHILRFRKVHQNLWHYETFVLPFETVS
ncbi:hypothetical protein FJY63_05610, partial [Candidatus Sumerlaeota bacterium]|nr:hypothetical protein [Candidatus Sumerlaeota bacterium]